MTRWNRADLETRYQMFNHFMLNDQRNYYNKTLDRHRTAVQQVNRWRAICALCTGLSAALAGLIVQVYFTNSAMCAAPTSDSAATCTALGVLVTILVMLSVVMPALGAFFSSLADLYQWDRMITIYDSAVENIEFADAQSPMAEMDDAVYRQSINAFVEGTLLVMSDETAQWGQSIRTPPQVADFVAKMREKASQIGGDADTPKSGTPGASTPSKPPAAPPSTPPG
jgi:predicted PurR-regulated permease PerM